MLHGPTPVLPAFGSGCLTDIMPAVLGHAPRFDALPDVRRGSPRVLLVLDGLGWDQLEERRAFAPTLSAMRGGPITSVAPSTTATALTSITTGLTPAEHGIVGYRMMVDGQVMNMLRWGTAAQPDGRKIWPPDVLQPYPPFLGERVGVLSKAEFRRTGFTGAHLRGGEYVGFRTTAVLVHEIGRLLRGGTDLVYAYYDGVDKVSHEYGLGSEFDAEVSYVDRLVAAVLEVVPTGTDVIVTADHGQVDCRGGLVPVAPEVRELIDGYSGEARFRWLHAPETRVDEVARVASEAHGHHAWIGTWEQMLDECWFGPSVRPEVRERFGDVALLPFENIGFDDPDDGGPFPLVGRHGSLTSAEMLVPLLVGAA